MPETFGVVDRRLFRADHVHRGLVDGGAAAKLLAVGIFLPSRVSRARAWVGEWAGAVRAPDDRILSFFALRLLLAFMLESWPKLCARRRQLRANQACGCGCDTANGLETV